MLRSSGAHLAGPEGALHVDPGVADRGHTHQQQRPQRSVGVAFGSARDLALRYQELCCVRMLLLVAQHAPAGKAMTIQ